MTAVLLAVTLAAPMPVDSWEAHWHDRVVETGGLTVALVEQRRAFYAQLEPEPEPAPIARSIPRAISPPVAVEHWRPLVAAYFAPEHVDLALRIIACESNGSPDAKNPRSTASGLWQHLASYWSERSAKAGWAGASIWEPEANTAVAAWLVYHGGGWGHWNASRGCW